jgi:hypothetical protein
VILLDQIEGTIFGIPYEPHPNANGQAAVLIYKDSLPNKSARHPAYVKHTTSRRDAKSAKNLAHLPGRPPRRAFRIYRASIKSRQAR